MIDLEKSCYDPQSLTFKWCLCSSEYLQTFFICRYLRSQHFRYILRYFKYYCLNCKCMLGVRYLEYCKKSTFANISNDAIHNIIIMSNRARQTKAVNVIESKDHNAIRRQIP